MAVDYGGRERAFTGSADWQPRGRDAPPARAIRSAKDLDRQLLRRIELRINAKSKEIRDLEGSINRAVLYPAIAAGAVIFDLIRKGTGF